MAKTLLDKATVAETPKAWFDLGNNFHNQGIAESKNSEDDKPSF